MVGLMFSDLQFVLGFFSLWFLISSSNLLVVVASEILVLPCQSPVLFACLPSVFLAPNKLFNLHQPQGSAFGF